MIWILSLLAFVISCLLTYALRRYALTKSLLDIPNNRSSHKVPTPRGGGLSFVIVFLFFLPVLVYCNTESIYNAIALLGAGSLIAIVGFFDDRGHIAARWRLLAHFTASLWLLYWLSGFPAFTVFGLTIPSTVMTILIVFYLVWLLNLYNFMDGIDGIASIESISSCLVMAFIYYITTSCINYSLIILSFAILGFLIWNFPPARIFMGDAGSGFLGIILGAYSIEGAWLSPNLFWAWLILLGVFIVDATWTLARRLVRGEKLYEAHRRHAYQFAARHFNSHLPITLAVLLINLLWLSPIAILVALSKLEGIAGLLIAYIPLLFLAFKFKAGTRDETK